MNHGRSVTAATVVIFLLLALSFFWPFNAPTALAQPKDAPVTAMTVSPRKSSRIRETIRGAERPQDIPDLIAYELFLRTIAEGNARMLLIRSGIKEDDADFIMSEADALNTILEGTDRKARELKNRVIFPGQLAGLSRLQTAKDTAVATAVAKNCVMEFHRKAES